MPDVFAGQVAPAAPALPGSVAVRWTAAFDVFANKVRSLMGQTVAALPREMIRTAANTVWGNIQTRWPSLLADVPFYGPWFQSTKTTVIVRTTFMNMVVADIRSRNQIDVSNYAQQSVFTKLEMENQQNLNRWGAAKLTVESSRESSIAFVSTTQVDAAKPHTWLDGLG